MSMDFSGEYRIPVGRERVWAALNDPDVLRRSIAGCTELERTEGEQFKAVMTARVGPIAVNFRGTVRLEDIDAPQGYTLIGEGQGGAAGFGKLSAWVTLESVAPQETVLRYRAEAAVGGKLANVGSRLLQSVAKKTADDFFVAFVAVLTGQAAAGAAAEAERAPVRAVDAPAPERERLGAGGGGLGAPVPARVVVFVAGLAGALGYCLALLK